MTRPGRKTRRLLWPIVTAAALASAAPASADTFLYASADRSSVYQYRADGDGRLSPLKPGAVGLPAGGASEIGVSPDGKSLYVGGGGYIAQFDVGSDGTLVPKRPAKVSLADLKQVFALAVSADGGSVFITDNDGVARYDVGAAGVLSASPSSHVALPSGGTGLAVSPDGASVYVPLPGSAGALAQFDVRADGTLSPKSPPTVPATEVAQQAVVSPDGASLYAAGSDRVYQFNVGSGGVLVPKALSFVESQGWFGWGLAMSSDGRSLYLTNQLTNTISQFAVGAGGALAPWRPFTVGAIDEPAYMAISPNGQWLYAASRSPFGSEGWISMYSRYQAGLSPQRPSRVQTGRSVEGLASVERNADAPTARADFLLASRVADVIHGGGGADTIRGLAGADTLSGGAGADTLSGDRGADRLRGGSGRDTVYGGPGNDTILVRDGRRDRVFCGRGRDTVRADLRDRLRGCERVRRQRVTDAGRSARARPRKRVDVAPATISATPTASGPASSTSAPVVYGD